MNFFSTTMDTFKQSLQLAIRNIKIFIPPIVFMLLNGILILIFVVILFCFLIISGISIWNDADFISIIMKTLPLAISALVIFGTIIPIIYIMFEAGVLGMLKATVQTGKAGMTDFFQGLKQYWFRIFIGINIVGLILIVLLFLILPAIVVGLAGILTFGWAFIFIGLVINIFFGIWASILVADDVGAWESIKRGFKFGKVFFWPLIIILLSSVLIPQYIYKLVGIIPFVGFLGALLAGSLMSTFFKLVVMKFYLAVRKGDGLIQ